MLRLVRSLALLIVLWIPGVAAADALGPPPTDCVQGAVGRSSRAGEWCAPTTCGPGVTTPCPTEHCPTRSYPCPNPEPYRCSEEPVGLCVRTETRSYTRRSDEGPQTFEEQISIALGPCGRNEACPERSTCQRVRRCVHASEDAPPENVRNALFLDVPAEEPSETESGGGSTQSGGACGCRAGASPRSSAAGLLLLGLVGLMLRRRP